MRGRVPEIGGFSFPGRSIRTQPHPAGQPDPSGESGVVLEVQLLVDMPDGVLDRFLLHRHTGGNGPIIQAIPHQEGTFQFPGTQIVSGTSADSCLPFRIELAPPRRTTQVYVVSITYKS